MRGRVMRHVGCCKGRESNGRKEGGVRVCSKELFVLKIRGHLAKAEGFNHSNKKNLNSWILIHLQVHRPHTCTIN